MGLYYLQMLKKIKDIIATLEETQIGKDVIKNCGTILVNSTPNKIKEIVRILNEEGIDIEILKENGYNFIFWKSK